MELSPEEERRLLNLSLIPAAIITYLLIAYFFYNIRDQTSLSLLYYMTHFGIPLVVIIPTTTFFSFEILYSRKTQSQTINFKRFLSRMLILFIGVTSLVIIVISMNYLLFLWLNEWNIFLLAGIIWFGLWIALFFCFKERFDKLYKGQW